MFKESGITEKAAVKAHLTMAYYKDRVNKLCTRRHCTRP
jgi:hypothetical protein